MLRFDIAAGNPLRLNGELIKKEPVEAEGHSRKKNKVSVSFFIYEFKEEWHGRDRR